MHPTAGQAAQLFDRPLQAPEVAGVVKSGQTAFNFAKIQGGGKSKRGPEPASARSTKPWEAGGVSRAWYYRKRQAQGRLAAAVQSRQYRGGMDISHLLHPPLSDEDIRRAVDWLHKADWVIVRNREGRRVRSKEGIEEAIRQYLADHFGICGTHIQ